MTHTKGFCEKYVTKSPDLEIFFLCNYHIQTIGSGRWPKYSMINFSTFLFDLSSLTCSKIWLIPLVDDFQCGYITKLRDIYIYMTYTEEFSRKYNGANALYFQKRILIARSLAKSTEGSSYLVSIQNLLNSLQDGCDSDCVPKLGQKTLSGQETLLVLLLYFAMEV